MQQPTPLQTHLYQFVTSVNSALVMQNRIFENTTFTFALKIDSKTGYLFLDVISEEDFKYKREDIVAGPSRAYIQEPTVALAIVGNPHSITYTLDMTNGLINVVRSYRINVDDAMHEVDLLKEEYTKNLEPGADKIYRYINLYHYNNLALSSVRDALFKAIALSMLNGDETGHPLIAWLNMGANSFIIPRLDSQGEIDGIILEINNLVNDHCSNVCLKYITKHHPTNDLMFMRNAGDRIDMAPLNHNSIVLDDDYYAIVKNGLEKGTILTEVFRDITEAKDD